MDYAFNDWLWRTYYLLLYFKFSSGHVFHWLLVSHIYLTYLLAHCLLIWYVYTASTIYKAWRVLWDRPGIIDFPLRQVESVCCCIRQVKFLGRILEEIQIAKVAIETHFKWEPVGMIFTVLHQYLELAWRLVWRKTNNLVTLDHFPIINLRFMRHLKDYPP